ncbi:hypothetical protein FB45DRAFT_927492 [Roridomyces roridus]|uniref:Uncharacterized protein n=1 Tax=Roridomyces roridus TaxID=1738132 RepID=A0AAD7BIU6_9AGAR|nr:hypothetical protein FB45DRAFT_927492 [Roridomyces roridus]
MEPTRPGCGRLHELPLELLGEIGKVTVPPCAGRAAYSRPPWTDCFWLDCGWPRPFRSSSPSEVEVVDLRGALQRMEKIRAIEWELGSDDLRSQCDVIYEYIGRLALLDNLELDIKKAPAEFVKFPAVSGLRHLTLKAPTDNPSLGPVIPRMIQSIAQQRQLTVLELSGSSQQWSPLWASLRQSQTGPALKKLTIYDSDSEAAEPPDVLPCYKISRILDSLRRFSFGERGPFKFDVRVREPQFAWCENGVVILTTGVHEFARAGDPTMRDGRRKQRA